MGRKMRKKDIWSTKELSNRERCLRYKGKSKKKIYGMKRRLEKEERREKDEREVEEERK